DPFLAGATQSSQSQKLALAYIEGYRTCAGANEITDPTTRVSALSRTEKSLVAIARALAVEADVLVLEEPTASLPADEVDRLFNAIRPLKDR
ncbi:hypothetical protein ACC698_37540, partial [Rhizobium johnstonii]